MEQKIIIEIGPNLRDVMEHMLSNMFHEDQKVDPEKFFTGLADIILAEKYEAPNYGMKVFTEKLK
jgi:hypothetical protein